MCNILKSCNLVFVVRTHVRTVKSTRISVIKELKKRVQTIEKRIIVRNSEICFQTFIKTTFFHLCYCCLCAFDLYLRSISFWHFSHTIHLMGHSEREKTCSLRMCVFESVCTCLCLYVYVCAVVITK